MDCAIELSCSIRIRVNAGNSGQEQFYMIALLEASWQGNMPHDLYLSGDTCDLMSRHAAYHTQLLYYGAPENG